jgi:hypothetical protein
MVAVLVERDGYVRVMHLEQWQEEVWRGERCFLYEDSGESWGGEETHWYREKGNEK